MAVDQSTGAAGLANGSGQLPALPAKVINLSLGLPTPSTPLYNALVAAVNEGCIVLCAAGNDGNGTPVLFPARHVEAIAIAALEVESDPNGAVAWTKRVKLASLPPIASSAARLTLPVVPVVSPFGAFRSVSE